MKNILRNAGWMENSINGYELIEIDNNYTQIPYKTSNAWQVILTQKKQEILQERLEQLPETFICKKDQIINKNINTVQIIGEEYLLNYINLKFILSQIFHY